MSPRNLLLAALILAPVGANAQPPARTAIQPAAQPAAPPPAPASSSDWLHANSDIPPDPQWRFGTLPNGVRWAVRRNARPERQVSIRVRIDAGALNERADEQGWAHLIEHLAFRGSARFADREARNTWQQLGASFGSDTNAFTDTTQTVYQLDLPNAAPQALDTSLAVLADMMRAALFEPATVAAEQRIVIAEKERRPELSVRLGEAGRRLFYPGLLIADRETIGTDATLAAATPAGLRAFYQRWYRPERAQVVLVGDADPLALEQLIVRHFGGWRGIGPPPAEPSFGVLGDATARVDAVAYPGAPTVATAAWVRPFTPDTPTRERERRELAERIGAAILNRRLERHARGTSAFISAGVGTQRTREAADVTQLSVTARGNGWREATGEAFGIISDALRAPPSAAEVERELANIRTAAEAAVQGEPTTRSPRWADRMIDAIDSRDVVTSASVALALFNAFAPTLTPTRIGEATRALFAGGPPRLLLLAPEVVAGGAPALAAGLAAAERAVPATRGEDRLVSFDALPPLGQPGREVARERIDDLDVTIVRFANGSTLTFKRTRFEEGRVAVRLRFGAGLAGFDPRRPLIGWASGVVAPSGVGDLDLDGLERLTTGRRIGLSFGVDEDAFVLSGATSASDLPDQLRLLATKLAHPRWDAALFRRVQTGTLDAYDLQFATAAARGQRELAALVHSGDPRWRVEERAEIAAATPQAFQGFFAPTLAQGPVHAVIVGDVALDAAIEAARRSIGALPGRATPAPPSDPAAVRPPAPDPAPRRFTHSGDSAQAYAAIGWSTLGGPENLRTRRALALAANIFQVRLFDRLREAEGATYAPSAAHLSSDTFRNWGILYAGAEVRPDRVPAFLAAAREIIADLAARPAAADEFARAQNPTVSGIERRLATNGYWLSAIEAVARDPAELIGVRSYLSDYRALTAEEVRRAVAAHVAEQGDWSMIVLPARTAGAAAAPERVDSEAAAPARAADGAR